MDHNERAKFGAYLRSLREERHFSQKEAAEAAQISSPYIAQLERGQRNPPGSDIICRLARAYQVPEQTLLQEAGYINGRDSIALIPTELIDRAFQFVCTDPKYTFGTRLKGSTLTTEAKAYIVQIYQESTKRVLLREDELKAAMEERQSAISEEDAL